MSVPTPHAMTKRSPEDSHARQTRLLYAAGKLQQAHRALAIGRPIIRHRLYDAYQALSPIVEGDVPKRYQATLRWIKRELTKKAPLEPTGRFGKDIEPSYYNGRLGSTLCRIKTAKAVKIAIRIVDLADAVSQLARTRQSRMWEAHLRRVKRSKGPAASHAQRGRR
jgi:hypothetical protein